MLQMAANVGRLLSTQNIITCMGGGQPGYQYFLCVSHNWMITKQSDVSWGLPVRTHLHVQQDRQHLAYSGMPWINWKYIRFTFLYGKHIQSQQSLRVLLSPSFKGIVSPEHSFVRFGALTLLHPSLRRLLQDDGIFLLLPGNSVDHEVNANYQIPLHHLERRQRIILT